MREQPASDVFAPGCLRLRTAEVHTVHALEVEIPRGRFTAVTGVSGSGKTTMVLESLVPALRARLDGATLPAHVVDLEDEGIRRVHQIDATPIGVNVRSTVATYSGVQDDLRRAFRSDRRGPSAGPEARRLLLQHRVLAVPAL